LRQTKNAAKTPEPFGPGICDVAAFTLRWVRIDLDPSIRAGLQVQYYKMRASWLNVLIS